MIQHQPLYKDYAPVKYHNIGSAFTPLQAGTDISRAKVYIILDDSGSMQSCRDATIDGFNNYIATQKDRSKNTIPPLVSLYKFDGKSVVAVFTDKHVDAVPLLNRDTYNPQGGTNLHDAIGSVMATINNNLTGELINVIILTDGEENASKTFTNSDVKQMVEKANSKNWGFLFMGANIDAFSVGSTLGFSSTNTWQYSTKNTELAFAKASDYTTAIRGSISRGMTAEAAYSVNNLSDAERKTLV